MTAFESFVIGILVFFGGLLLKLFFTVVLVVLAVLMWIRFPFNFISLITIPILVVSGILVWT